MPGSCPTFMLAELLVRPFTTAGLPSFFLFFESGGRPRRFAFFAISIALFAGP